MTTVLVVDDSPIDRRLAGGLLQREGGWQVLFAENGREALDLLAGDVLPELILTDLSMPEVNGLELVQKVHRQYPQLPVILMTARGSEELAVQALQEGAASYVPKRVLAKCLATTAKRVVAAIREARNREALFGRLKHSEHVFEIPSDMAYVSALVGYLQQLMQISHLFGEAVRLRVGIALEEALSNAYYHGNLELDGDLRESDFAGYHSQERDRAADPRYRERPILATVRVDRDAIEFTITDQGRGFDPATLPDPNDPANLDRASGRGLVLMRTFMDDVRYNASGNSVTMVKKRPPPLLHTRDDDS
jgi:CheY-like chemotaxis protein